MHRQPIQQQLVVNRRIICPHIRLEDEVMVREVGQPLPYCIFESAMAFEMGTARRERQIGRRPSVSAFMTTASRADHRSTSAVNPLMCTGS